MNEPTPNLRQMFGEMPKKWQIRLYNKMRLKALKKEFYAGKRDFIKKFEAAAKQMGEEKNNE